MRQLASLGMLAVFFNAFVWLLGMSVSPLDVFVLLPGTSVLAMSVAHIAYLACAISLPHIPFRAFAIAVPDIAFLATAISPPRTASSAYATVAPGVADLAWKDWHRVGGRLAHPTPNTTKPYLSTAHRIASHRSWNQPSNRSDPGASLLYLRTGRREIPGLKAVPAVPQPGSTLRELTLPACHSLGLCRGIAAAQANRRPVGRMTWPTTSGSRVVTESEKITS
eukprot:864022-Rhodomonas_salina.3